MLPSALAGRWRGGSSPQPRSFCGVWRAPVQPLYSPQQKGTHPTPDSTKLLLPSRSIFRRNHTHPTALRAVDILGRSMQPSGSPTRGQSAPVSPLFQFCRFFEHHNNTAVNGLKMAERLALLSAPPGGIVRVSPRLELVPIVDTPSSTGSPTLPTPPLTLPMSCSSRYTSDHVASGMGGCVFGGAGGGAGMPLPNIRPRG